MILTCLSSKGQVCKSVSFSFQGQPVIFERERKNQLSSRPLPPVETSAQELEKATAGKTSQAITPFTSLVILSSLAFILSFQIEILNWVLFKEKVKVKYFILAMNKSWHNPTMAIVIIIIIIIIIMMMI